MRATWLPVLASTCRRRQLDCSLQRQLRKSTTREVWTPEFFAHFGRVLDEASASCFVVTTRIRTLCPHAATFELGLLARDDAVSLLLEVRRC